MAEFYESNRLLDDPPGLRKRLRDDGYVFLRDMLPAQDVLGLRRQILEICRGAGWLRSDSAVLDGVTDHAPILEGEDAYNEVYAKVQALESFHRLKFDVAVMNVMEDLFQEPVVSLPQSIARIAFPNDNARGTQPHQDWIFVGGSTETISCWVPLGDISLEVGGLKVLAGSHKAGFLEPRPAPGPGNRIVDVDPTLEWHQSAYRTGDILQFKSLTVHAAATNLTSDKLRLSADFRYTGTSHVITDEWLLPHGNIGGERLAWDTLEKGWEESPVSHYWSRWPSMKVKPHAWFWEKADSTS
ncbi:MAG: phytanoyl-CoA dioxygenase family protein [Paracoccaceae bacterium]|nr:phytanoyl-CoA dioxygenase family protein [Paracoccaceae bacterium]